MIHDIDESLRALVRRDVLNGSGIEVSFDAPTRDWSSRRNTPTINFYLYDIREDLTRRKVQFEELRDEHGKINGRRMPPRQFKLSYMITAWTQRAEDEHRLLSAVLSCFLRFDVLPEEMFRGEVTEKTGPVRLTVGLPLSADRSISDVWSALGGELKPSLDLVVGAPFDPQRSLPVGPPVLEEHLISRQAVDLASLAESASAERAGGDATVTSERRSMVGDPATGEITPGPTGETRPAPRRGTIGEVPAVPAGEDEPSGPGPGRRTAPKPPSGGKHAK